jgi:hypothetical protein
MEIKAELLKPYTETQRINFIVNYNHNLGYEIRETETALEAWGYTEDEKREQEQERIGNLQCTKRVFVLMLEQLGLDYFTQLEPVINANRQAKLEWELCVELQRKNPLLDQLALQFGITSKQLDDLFKFANGEITQEEFLNK